MSGLDQEGGEKRLQTYVVVEPERTKRDEVSLIRKNLTDDHGALRRDGSRCGQ